MIKPDKTVVRETKYIGLMVIVFSVIMEVVFAILGKWSYRVLLGNLLGALAMIFNFYYMGIGVQKALTMDKEDAKKVIKASHSVRTFVLFAVVGIGALLKCFSTLAVIIPMLFPRIAIALRPLWKSDKQGGNEK